MFSRFERLAVATKLSIAFFIFILLLGVLSGMTIWRVNMLVDSTEALYKKDLIGVSLIRQLNRDVNAIGRILNRSLLARSMQDSTAAAEAAAALDGVKKGMFTNLEGVKGTIIRPELKAKLAAPEDQLGLWFKSIDNIIKVSQGDDGAAKSYQLVAGKDIKQCSLKQLKILLKSLPLKQMARVSTMRRTSSYLVC